MAIDCVLLGLSTLRIKRLHEMRDIEDSRWFVNLCPICKRMDSAGRLRGKLGHRVHFENIDKEVQKTPVSTWCFQGWEL